MSLYLDASVLVPLFFQESASRLAQATLANETLLLSNFAAAEFSAAIARRVRVGDLPAAQAPVIFSAFDEWAAQSANAVTHGAADMQAAIAIVRRLELGIRAPDALHIAATQRLGATLFTFDLKMAAAAKALGVTVAS